MHTSRSATQDWSVEAVAVARCNPGINLASAIRASMVTACRFSRQRRFNACRMGTLARQSRSRLPITTRSVSFEVALLQSVLLANGHHQPTRFGLKLAVGRSTKKCNFKKRERGTPQLPRRPHPGRKPDASHNLFFERLPRLPCGVWLRDLGLKTQG